MVKKLIIVLFLSVFQLFCQTNSNLYLITSSSIGSIKIGMTLKEAQEVCPTLKFERTEDADGRILVSVQENNENLMILDLAEDEFEGPLNWLKQIKSIETFNPLYKTANGVHVGLKLNELEKIYGEIVAITLSEIESREFVEFENQPENIAFRIDYCGEYLNGSRMTKKYSENCSIFSIIIF